VNIPTGGHNRVECNITEANPTDTRFSFMISHLDDDYHIFANKLERMMVENGDLGILSTMTKVVHGLCSLK
jgi:hypothetical protein